MPISATIPAAHPCEARARESLSSTKLSLLAGTQSTTLASACYLDCRRSSLCMYCTSDKSIILRSGVSLATYSRMSQYQLGQADRTIIILVSPRISGSLLSKNNPGSCSATMTGCSAWRNSARISRSELGNWKVLGAYATCSWQAQKSIRAELTFLEL